MSLTSLDWKVAIVTGILTALTTILLRSAERQEAGNIYEVRSQLAQRR